MAKYKNSSKSFRSLFDPKSIDIYDILRIFNVDYNVSKKYISRRIKIY